MFNGLLTNNFWKKKSLRIFIPMTSYDYIIINCGLRRTGSEGRWSGKLLGRIRA
jgi:hypothetical protein